MTGQAPRIPTPFIIWALVGAIVLAYVAFVLATPEQQTAIENIALHLGTVTVDGRKHAAQPSTFDHPRHLKGPGPGEPAGIRAE